MSQNYHIIIDVLDTITGGHLCEMKGLRIDVLPQRHGRSDSQGTDEHILNATIILSSAPMTGLGSAFMSGVGDVS